MTKAIAAILTIFTACAHAASFLVYNAQAPLHLQLKKNFGAAEVFTPKEKELLSGSHVQTNVLKLELDEKALKAVKGLVESHSETLLQSNPAQELYALPDPYESMQWGLKNNGDDLVEWESDIDVVTTTGVPGEDIGANSLEEVKGQKVRVAVIDSGVDVNHPDLAGQILVKEKECQAMREYNKCLNTNPDRDSCHEKYANADRDGNGYPMDCNGWNLGAADIPGAKVSGGPKIFDGDGHGTHVAGVIGAKRNKKGVVGVIQNVEIIPVQVGITSQSADKKEAPTDKIAKGILYAIEARAQVINLSLGWRFDQDSILMRQMIELALSKDILVVAAAGNDAHDGPVYPCSYEGVVCVASHTVNGSLSEFSNYGAHVDIAAPGAKILSSWPGNKRSRFFTQEDAYEYMSGTSQAAPHVAGVLARLLNLGFAPSEALVKLLKGSRPFSADEGKLLRNGKADLKLAASVDTGAFLYPANKSAALVKWEESPEDRSFILKLDNLGAKSTNTVVEIKSVPSRGEAVEVTTKRLHLGTVEAGARIKKRIHFSAPFRTHGEFLFKVKIESDQENKSYFIQAKAVNIVDGEGLRNGQTNFAIVGANALEDTAINKFENFTEEAGVDLLAVKTVKKRTFLSLLKQHGKQSGAHYEQTEWQRIPEENPVLLKLSKVDLEQDGAAEYVVTLVSLGDKQRKTKFFVFDSEFKPKRTLVAPKNVYDNELAVMPGGFKWAQSNGRMVPAWIGVGQRPESERPQAGPWSDPKPEPKINRLYLLLPEGLKTIAFEGEEEMPLHLLYQSEESKRLGRITLVTGDSYGYYKKYSTYQYLNGLKKINRFELFPFVDLLNVKPLPMANAAGDNAFFTESSLNGARVVGLDIVNGQMRLSKKRITPFSNKEKVQRVLSFDGENAIYQTNYHLAYGNSKLPAKTGIRRIKHEILQSQSALYLRSSLSPGLTGELINISGKGELRLDSRWLMLGVQGCSEIGFAKEDGVESLVFACTKKSPQGSQQKHKIIQFQLTR